MTSAVALLGSPLAAIAPRGEGAQRISELWWVMFGLSLVGFAVVLLALGLALRRRGREGPRAHDRRLIIGGAVLAAVLVVPTIAMTITTSRALSEDDAPAFEIEVTGHQFWWDLRYPMPGSTRLDEGRTFRTANEIHIPVGQTVRLRLRSADVVHSFWIPELQGKRDLLPGHENTLDLHATEPGEYRGQCAELCGRGHALMRLLVVAHPPDEYEAWLRRESGPVAVQPDAAMREEFGNSCAPCHDLRGVFERETFGGDVGPDLTHLASRRTLAAGVLPNTREALGRWIIDPEGVKPGSRMPDVLLDAGPLTDVVDYLRELE